MIAAPSPDGAEAVSGCALSRRLPAGATTTQLKPHAGEVEGKGDARAQLAMTQVDVSNVLLAGSPVREAIKVCPPTGIISWELVRSLSPHLLGHKHWSRSQTLNLTPLPAILEHPLEHGPRRAPVGETTQLVKCSLPKHQHLYLILGTHRKSQAK